MIRHTRGDSFFKVLIFPAGALPTGLPPGYWAGWTVKSQIRRLRDGELLADCLCAWADPLTTMTLSVEVVDTSEWTVCQAKWDVQWTRISDGVVVSTQLDIIEITADSTQ